MRASAPVWSRPASVEQARLRCRRRAGILADGPTFNRHPGGLRHAGSVTAYITKGEIRSQLAGGAVETFKVGQSFFEPPGAVHLVSANASMAEPAELIAVFVADEGAQLTTFVD